MTRSTTPATASRDTTTTLQEDHDMTADYYARALATVAGLRLEKLLPISRVIGNRDLQHDPAPAKSGQRSRARLCYSYRKPKGPMLENIFGSEVASPTYKRAFVMSEFNRRAPARAGMVAGRMGHTARLAARRNPCFQHPAHPLRLKTWLVDPESRSGVPTMTQAIATLARTHAPIITLASRHAAPIQSATDTTDPQIIGLHIAAENALAAALGLLRNPTGTTADLERATARACRAATLLKRACAAQEGSAA